VQIVIFCLAMSGILHHGCHKQEFLLKFVKEKLVTSMISKVKGKAEVSLYLAGLLPVATLFFLVPCILRSF